MHVQFHNQTFKEYSLQIPSSVPMVEVLSDNPGLAALPIPSISSSYYSQNTRGMPIIFVLYTSHLINTERDLNYLNEIIDSNFVMIIIPKKEINFTQIKYIILNMP